MPRVRQPAASVRRRCRRRQSAPTSGSTAIILPDSARPAAAAFKYRGTGSGRGPRSGRAGTRCCCPRAPAPLRAVASGFRISPFATRSAISWRRKLTRLSSTASPTAPPCEAFYPSRTTRRYGSHRRCDERARQGRRCSTSIRPTPTPLGSDRLSGPRRSSVQAPLPTALPSRAAPCLGADFARHATIGRVHYSRVSG